MAEAAGQVFQALEIERLKPAATADQETPESLARRYRELVGVSLAEQFSWSSDYEAFGAWRRAIERLNALVLQASMPVEEVRAFSVSTADVPVIVVNSGDVVVARIFSLFHELGHLLLGHSGICDPTTELVQVVTTHAEERFCNAFAGALLVPSGMLKAETQAQLAASAGTPGSQLQRLANRYWVSRQVMWYRLRDVGMISEETFRKGWPFLERPEREAEGRQPSDNFVSPPSWRRVLTETGRGFMSHIFEAQDRGLISAADIVDWLEIKTSDLGRLEEQLTRDSR